MLLLGAAGVARVVVLGSGFAGVEALGELSRLGVCEKHDCLMVTRRAVFTFVPLVPALVSGAYRREDVELDVRGYVEESGAGLVEAHVEAVEPGRLALSDGEKIDYDYLVIAAGARPAFFNVPGAEEHSIPVYGPGEALELRERIEKGASRIVIVGAGFVGVEVAAEALRLAKKLGRELEVVLVDMLDKPLGLLGNPLASRLVGEILEEMGARFVLGRAVKRVMEDGVELADGTRLGADAVVWSAGFQGPGLRLPKEALARRGFVSVDEYLRVPGLPGAYAAGDAAAVACNGCPALKMAREAITMGLHAARSIAAELGVAEAPGGYRPRLHACAPQAGVTLADRGVVIAGKALAMPSRIPIYYHERLLREYQAKILGGQGAG